LFGEYELGFVFDDEPTLWGEQGHQQLGESLDVGHRIGRIGKDEVEQRRRCPFVKPFQAIFAEGRQGVEGVAGGDMPGLEFPAFGDLLLVGDVFFCRGRCYTPLAPRGSRIPGR